MLNIDKYLNVHVLIPAIKPSYPKNGRLKDCDICVTIRFYPMCAGAIILTRIRNLFYVTEHLKPGACIPDFARKIFFKQICLYSRKPNL